MKNEFTFVRRFDSPRYIVVYLGLLVIALGTVLVAALMQKPQVLILSLFLGVWRLWVFWEFVVVIALELQSPPILFIGGAQGSHHARRNLIWLIWSQSSSGTTLIQIESL
ncbi:hypothetical protein LOC67_26985 [Stieleria sp. JC731]|uniref:hypothetical protein n=1 Tax=Stieleria sp. JC731 TaxID=2894195 RepID=UPI001E38FEED|nr:hypothetical protein [Stieleria sp. JC731]MCC9604215.1 hypothetical protein [Stieleria sp. JC731]